MDAVNAVVTAFAAEAGVPVHTAERDEHGWIASQAAGPALEWAVRWEATRWRSDGLRFAHEGTDICTARSGTEANKETGPRVAARLNGSDRGLVRLRTSLTIADETRRAWHNTPMERAPGLPATRELHRLARGGARPSEMFQPQPDTTPLDLMWALSDSFNLSLDEVAPIGAWRRGELAAAQADPALSALIQSREHKWGLGWLLAGAWYRKDPMRKTMLAYKDRGVGVIEMILGLREAFRFRLPHGKEIVNMCCSSHYTDAEFEARFRECVTECA